MPSEMALSKNDPRIIAWEKYKVTEEYANSLRWAAYEEHREGSLWATFLAGYEAYKIEMMAKRFSEHVKLLEEVAHDRDPHTS